MDVFLKKYKVISLLMAMLMLGSSTGFSFDLHYCQGNLKSVSLIGKARSCHDEVLPKTCHQESNKSTNKGCCDNQKVVVDLDSDYVQNKSLDVSRDDILKSIAITSQQYIHVFEDQFCYNNHYQHYKPPLLIKDIPVFVQSFLI